MLKQYNVAIVLIIAILTLLIAVLAWQFPRTPKDKISLATEEINNTKIFKGSIFDLAKQVSMESTTLSKTEMSKKNNSLIVKETGYITNLSSIDNQFIAIINYSTSSKDMIICKFNASWGDALNSANIPYKVSFQGTIDAHSDYISLSKCSLIN